MSLCLCGAIASLAPMLKWIFLLLVLWTSVLAAEMKSPLASNVDKKIIVIPVEGEVDYGLYAFLKRSVAEALPLKPDYIVFKVNTFGGELHAAFEIVDLLMGISQCSTYVFVEQKAISAGALISLSANRIAMGQGTTIGDCAPITQGQDGIVMLGEKIQSPLRAKFRNLAEKNGYPSLLAQSMVSTDLGVVQAFKAGQDSSKHYFTVKQWDKLSAADQAPFISHKILVADGELLTMTDLEAQALGFSQGSFANFEAFIKAKHWQATQEFKSTWSEDLVRWLGKLSPILMLLGFGALYLEFKTPGASFFGWIGFIALGIVFFSHYAIGLAHYTELLLLIGGFILFLLEIYFFPGTLILGALGVICIMAGLVLSMQAYTFPDPKMPWELRDMLKHVSFILALAVSALAIPFLAMRFLSPILPKGYQVVSLTTLKDAKVITEESRDLHLGQSGFTKTGLRPMGKAVFADKTYEVVARSHFIEAETVVEIVEVTGNKIVVKRRDDLVMPKDIVV